MGRSDAFATPALNGRYLRIGAIAPRRLKGLNPPQSGRARNRRLGFEPRVRPRGAGKRSRGPTTFRSIPFRNQETMLSCLGRRKKTALLDGGFGKGRNEGKK